MAGARLEAGRAVLKADGSHKAGGQVHRRTEDDGTLGETPLRRCAQWRSAKEAGDLRNEVKATAKLEAQQVLGASHTAPTDSTASPRTEVEGTGVGVGEGSASPAVVPCRSHACFDASVVSTPE